MSDSDMRERPDRSHRAAGAVFDLFGAELLRPLLRPRTVRRSSLIERLARGDPRPIVSVVAPAGCGKTTLLSQWAERNGQAFAWVSVDEGDNDPKVLLTYVAEALDAVEPIDGRVFDALASPVSSVPGSVVPRLGSAFSSMTSPVVLLLDDVHTLHNRECRAALSVLADHVPAGSRLALAGRAELPLRVARLRAEGRILEIGPGDLSLTPEEEASSLLRNADVALSGDEVAELHRRTEGWPAGLYLAALYLREGGPLASAAVSFGGGDRLVSEYMESEFLARISGRQRVFLTRTAVLERLSGPLCDAVLELTGSAVTLAETAAPPAGACGTACPRRRWNTRWRLGTPTRPLAWWRNSRCRPTGKAGSQPSSDGSDAARQELVSAQRLRHLLTYALPHFAVQARIELARVHLALADLAGARTLMREVDELLRRQPNLGDLAGEARALRAQLAKERDSNGPGASALTGAELRLLPMLSTHLSFPEIAEELFLSRNTVKSQAYSIYRKLGASSRSQAVTRSRELGLLEGDDPVFHPIRGMKRAPARGGMVAGRRAEMYGPDGEIPGDVAQAGDDR